MAFIGNIFGAFGARAIGNYNAQLYSKQAELARKNAEVKKQVFQNVDKPRIIAQQVRDRSNVFVQFIKSGVDVDRIGESPFLVMLDQTVEQAFDLEIAECNSTVAYENQMNNASLLQAKGAGERFKGEIAFRTGILKAAGQAGSNYNQTGSLLG